jgi:hypothetical protein
LSQRRVLAISPELQQLQQIKDQLEGAGAEVDAVQSIEGINADILRHRYLFVGTGTGSAHIDVLQRVLREANPNAHIAVVCGETPLETLTQILSDRRVNHVITGDKVENAIRITAAKLLTGDIFGIEKYIPPGTEVRYIRLNDFEGRDAAIETVQAYAEECKVRRQVRSAIGQVCEELLMNALYDAPVDASGKQVFADLDPHKRRDTCSPRPVSIRYAATPDGFAVAVRDRYGRLAKNTILSYIEKCLSSGNQIDRKTYGAGLGLYLVANAATSYIVNVAYDIATEVICTFSRKGKAPLSLVGVFVHPGRAEKLSVGPVPAKR